MTARAPGTRFLRLAAAAAAVALTAVAAAQQEDRAYDIPGRGTLTLSVPADWYDEPKAGPSGIPTIRFFDRIEAPRALDMSVTVLWSPPGASPYAAQDQLRALVAKAAEDVAPGAAEREFPLQELAVESGGGFYFEATAKATQPGEPAYLTRGALAAGDVTITFTILATEFRSQGVAQAIEMLRTARREATR